MTAARITAPDGSLWQLVPVEPDEAMIAAGWNAGEEGRPDEEIKTVFAAMLAAAPEFGGEAVGMIFAGQRLAVVEGPRMQVVWYLDLPEGTRIYTHPSAADEMMGMDAARWRHARHHALVQLLQAYPTPDTSDVGLDYAVDVAIAAMRQ